MVAFIVLLPDNIHIKKLKYLSPDYGPLRLPALALFSADVSHTANSNTQLMLLYETNERTNERKI